jgi:flagellar basal-body rod modification protein FlgD
MENVSANYAMPTIVNALTQPAGKLASTTAKAKASDVTATGSASTTATSASASSIGTTFLNLLAQELQNQDPTAPVDSTAMVGQMISLNQLDQLISINQGITGTTTTATQADVATALSPSTAAATTSQLPFDPNTMMPVSSGSSGSTSSAYSIPNVSMMGSSNLNSNTSGGK